MVPSHTISVVISKSAMRWRKLSITYKSVSMNDEKYLLMEIVISFSKCQQADNITITSSVVIIEGGVSPCVSQRVDKESAML